MAGFALMLCLVVATSVAIPVPDNEDGLDAALANIANSVVVLSDDTPQQDTNPTVEADVPAFRLESANALPSLGLIALTPDAPKLVAETEKLVYSNDTDSKGVVKILVLSSESGENSSGEATTETTVGTTVDENDGTESNTEVTTDKLAEVTKSSTTTSSTLSVIAIHHLDKEKEDEIKENIKEVEATPVIFVAGV